MKSIMKKGFTLIELLVVITIIGILATGAVTVYTTQIQKARDATRISDLSALDGAINQIYQDAYQFPLATAAVETAVQTYIINIPTDPRNATACAGSGAVVSICGYVYNVGADSNGVPQGSYEISTGFENRGNITNRAINSSDAGNDGVRLERGILVAGTTNIALVTLWATGTTPPGTSGWNVAR